jgi:DNA-binding response OmpR family regulator
MSPEAEMKLLAVDDDVVTHMMLAMGLEDVELLEATRADEGFKRATREEPDGVVIDLRLPDGNGLDLVRKLRHQIGINQVPIVVLTASHDPEEEAAVLSAGADAYMAKPFDAQDVAAHLEAIIQVPASQRRGLRRQSISLLRDHQPVPPLVTVRAPQAAPVDKARARGSWWHRTPKTGD